MYKTYIFDLDGLNGKTAIVFAPFRSNCAGRLTWTVTVVAHEIKRHNNNMIKKDFIILIIPPKSNFQNKFNIIWLYTILFIFQ